LNFLWTAAWRKSEQEKPLRGQQLNNKTFHVKMLCIMLASALLLGEGRYGPWRL
jgi:hypothetical protein